MKKRMIVLETLGPLSIQEALRLLGKNALPDLLPFLRWCQPIRCERRDWRSSTTGERPGSTGTFIEDDQVYLTDRLIDFYLNTLDPLIPCLRILQCLEYFVYGAANKRLNSLKWEAAL